MKVISVLLAFLATLSAVSARQTSIPLTQVDLLESSTRQAVESFNLDLTATERSLTAGRLLIRGTVVISEGGSVRSITPDSMLTPAEKLAAYQVVSSGVQSIVLGQRGDALGGSFSVDPHFNQFINGLVIPEGVTAKLDFGINSHMRLTGDLVNAGTLLATSSNHAITTATISANKIFNHNNGVISSTAGGFAGAKAPLNLSLTTALDLVNHGSVSSSGNLSLSEGSKLINAPDTYESAVPASVLRKKPPSIQAHGDITISAASLVNAGTIRTAVGSIKTNTTTILSSTDGLVQALNGTIDLGNASNSNSAGLLANNGSFIAKQVAFNAGSGKLVAQLQRVDGILKSQGKCAKVSVRKGSLRLGDVDIDGDPTYFNSAVNGDVEITGNVAVQESLSIIASRNITTTSSVTSIQSNSSRLGRSFDINLIAGANIIAGDTVATNIGATPPVSENATSVVTISGASNSGGNVDFSASPNMSLNDNSGGNVLLSAFSKGASGGKILLPAQTSKTNLGVTINASGRRRTTPNGTIRLIAGAPSGTSITTGKLVTTGGRPGTGDISISTAMPVSSNNKPISFGTDGSIVSGNFLKPGTTMRQAHVSINNNLLAGNTISVESGANTTTTPGVIATVDVGQSRTIEGYSTLCQGIALNHAGTYAYVANLLDNSVSVIRTSDNCVVDTIQVGPPSPGEFFAVLEGLALTPDDRYLLVASVLGDGPTAFPPTPGGYVAVIRTSDNAVISKIPALLQFPFPVAITIDAQGKYAYISNEGFFAIQQPSTMSVMNIPQAIKDPSTVVLKQVLLGLDPFQQALSIDGRIIYTLNAFDPSLAVIDTVLARLDPARAVLKTVSLGPPIPPDGDIGAFCVAMHPSGNRLYIASSEQNILQLLNTRTNTLYGKVTNVGPVPTALSIEPAGTFMFVINSNVIQKGQGTMSILRTGDNTKVAEVPLGLIPIVITNNFAGFSGAQLLAYARNEGIPSGSFFLNGNTASAVRMPSMSSPHIKLTSLGGDINAVVNTHYLTANTKGSGVGITTNNNITVGPSSAGKLFQLGTTRGLTVAGPISAPNIQLFHPH